MTMKLDIAADCMDALGNPTRLALFRMLIRAGADGLPVGHIQKELGIPASTLTHHLKHLELVRLVGRRKEGTTHFCSANYGVMEHLLLFLTEECCADADRPDTTAELSPELKSTA